MSAALSRPRDGRTQPSNVARPSWDQDVNWQSRALCRGADAELFFAPHHMEKKEERTARESQAKAICARCPVREQCLEFALTVREPHGIWGGLNELERRRLLARRAG